jgi:MoaA/NifB/PqqE/SkfB family radical SAM enzyme
MESRTFARIIDGLKDFALPPLIFFGGFGEPLSHPDIIDMVRQAKAIGSRIELITNGTLLTSDMSKGLISAGLDMLWISLDGASPESYADVRLGARLPKFSPILRPSDVPAVAIIFFPNRRLELPLWL